MDRKASRAASRSALTTTAEALFSGVVTLALIQDCDRAAIVEQTWPALPTFAS